MAVNSNEPKIHQTLGSPLPGIKFRPCMLTTENNGSDANSNTHQRNWPTDNRVLKVNCVQRSLYYVVRYRGR